MHTNRVHRTVPITLCALFVALLAAAGLADPDRIPGQAKVALARREKIFFDPNPISTFMYPEGKLDFRIIEPMLDEAVASLTGVTNPVDSWGAMVKPVDVVGILVDVRDLPVHLTVVDAVVQKLLRAGVQRDNIVIFSGEEYDLFNAGFEIRRAVQGDPAGEGVGTARVEATEGLIAAAVGHRDVLAHGRAAASRGEPDLGCVRIRKAKVDAEPGRQAAAGVDP